MVEADLKQLMSRTAAMTTPSDAPLPPEGKRVWVAGHRGMVGAAVVRRLAVRALRDSDRRPRRRRFAPAGARSRPG